MAFALSFRQQLSRIVWLVRLAASFSRSYMESGLDRFEQTIVLTMVK